MTSDRIVVGNPDYAIRIAAQAGTLYQTGAMICIARARGDTLLGGVIFSNYTHESVAMHSASWHPRWINRDLLWICFDYPFNQMGVKRIFGQVPEDNWRALRFNRNLGFKIVTRIEGVYLGPTACVVMKMERDDCRFLSLKPKTIQSNVVDAPEEATDGR